MSSSTDNASSVTASQPKVEAAASADTSSGAAAAQQDPKPKCNDPKHARVLEKLMALYHTSTYKNHSATHLWAGMGMYNQLPDKHDICDLIYMYKNFMRRSKRYAKKPKKPIRSSR